MKRFYYRFRIVLFTLALGLASISFFNNLSEKWNEVSVKLPQTESESPIYVQLKKPEKIPENSVRFNPDIITQYRDLSLYDFGGRNGYCDYQNAPANRNCKKFRSKVRDYIWQHWRDKKRAYIILEYSGIDSQSDAHVFIEPGKNGQWHIDWKWETETVRQAADIHSIKFKRAKEDGHTNKDGYYSVYLDKYYLSFIDKDGEEVEAW